MFNLKLLLSFDKKYYDDLWNNINEREVNDTIINHMINNVSFSFMIHDYNVLMFDHLNWGYNNINNINNIHWWNFKHDHLNFRY